MCGIVAGIGTSNSAQEIFLGLTTLQHRGQDGAGILSQDSTQTFHLHKGLGLIDSVFTRESIARLTGRVAIGHTRYSTSGRGVIDEVQPFVLNYPFGLSLVHNGNLINTGTLARVLKDRDRRTLLTHSDTEILINLLAAGLARHVPGGAELSNDSVFAAVTDLYREARGSFSCVAMIGGVGLVAFRDPRGIRPLVLGQRSDGAWMVASESVALEFNGYTLVRDVAPGEAIVIREGEPIDARKIVVPDSSESRAPHAPCMFEWVYFASPESVLDQSPVYGTRIELGRHLAHFVRKRLEERGLKADVVVPVPETARIAAISLAEELGTPYRELLIKNRYIKRTFILDSDEKRRSAVSLKLSPVRSEIVGKTVVLVDDSIVRGTTSRKLIELVRGAGAAHVVFVSTCPPIRYPCFYGIDFPSKEELLAHGRTGTEIEEELGADAVVYLDQQGLELSIGKKSLCTACLTGTYPTEVQEAGVTAARRVTERGLT